MYFTVVEVAQIVNEIFYSIFILLAIVLLCFMFVRDMRAYKKRIKHQEKVEELLEQIVENNKNEKNG